MATALYPGAYKPPHRGHFEVVKKLLDGTHNGVQYNLSDMQSGFNKALQGDKDKVEKIDKVIVFIGGGVRNGISEKESKSIYPCIYLTITKFVFKFIYKFQLLLLFIFKTVYYYF